LPELGRADIGPIAKRFDRSIDPLRIRLLLLVNIISFNIIIASSGLPRSFAAERALDLPTWLRTHVGEGEGEIDRRTNLFLALRLKS
jgi:hypothetical protein